VDAGFGGGIADDADGLARAFAGSRVGLGTLAADGQTPEVSNSAIAFDALQALQDHANFPAQIAFDQVFSILNGMDNL